ncbi:hypothetical protein O5169_27850 [Escherichia coli]|nr:hypothetical protein [Escherichia coli]
MNVAADVHTVAVAGGVTRDRHAPVTVPLMSQHVPLPEALPVSSAAGITGQVTADVHALPSVPLPLSRGGVGRGYCHR